MNTKIKFNQSLPQVWFRKNLAFEAGILLLCMVAARSPAQIYTVLHHFTGGDGSNSEAGLVLSGTTLFGSTSVGGISKYGTLFEINTDGSGFAVLKQFTYVDGCTPLGPLVLSGATLYGCTMQGGSKGVGTVFTLNANGGGFATVMGFTWGTNGAYPEGGLVMSGTTLYGTTSRGGSSDGNYDGGTVYKVNSDGNGYVVLKSFRVYSTNGYSPYGTLVLSDGTLYGATASGGTSDYGTVYKINTDGSGFTILKSFNGHDGQGPLAGLILSGTTLYGTTYWGGSSWSNAYTGNGTVFKINTDGSGFEVLRQFAGNDGSGPYATVVLGGTKVYGATRYGGSSGKGTLFQLNTNGSDFTVLKNFNGSDGANPLAEMTLLDTTLYGTTATGGNFNAGVIFSLSIAPPTVQGSPVSRTVETGATVDFGPDAGNDPSLKGEWLLNGTNLFSCSTNCRLVLTNVQISQSGIYILIASNLFGAVTSAPMTLNVIPQLERTSVPGVKVMGAVGNLLSVEYANSLSPAPDWLPLDTVNLTNTPQYYFDLTKPLPSQRFYRAWQSGTPAVVPSLNLNFVPAITLTGSIGNSLRLDCINPIGPTDAWVTLDTVTLTNTTQLYFDTTAVGQPARLYRIVPIL
jgi:uncharacterized repeat protein (TIGR03803 family)